MAGAVSSVVNGPVTEVNFKAILTDAKPLGIGCHSNFGAVAGLVHLPYRPSARHQPSWASSQPLLQKNLSHSSLDVTMRS